MTLDDDVPDSLAAERTSLAWNRSSLALFACGAVVVKGVPRLNEPKGRPVVGGVIVALAIVAALAAMWEERSRRRTVAAGVAVIDGRTVRRVAYANALIGVAAFGLAAIAG
jgi:uncharacterized membrane protein YidH (DUF202 family)